PRGEQRVGRRARRRADAGRGARRGPVRPPDPLRTLGPRLPGPRAEERAPRHRGAGPHRLARRQAGAGPGHARRGVRPLPLAPPRRGAKVELFDDLGALLSRSDFLTVHTPLTEETEGMIGRAELAALPDGAVVVNAARGGIVDEAALLWALECGKVFAAGLDVFVLEPPTPDNPLIGRDDVVLTAHLGANTVEAQGRVGTEILERTVMALKGDYSRGVVNAPALAPQVVAALGDHLELGEVLGRVVSQLGGGRVRELEIELAGEFPIDPDPI